MASARLPGVAQDSNNSGNLNNYIRREALSVSLKKNLEGVESVQRIVDKGSKKSLPTEDAIGRSRYSKPKDRVRGKTINIA